MNKLPCFIYGIDAEYMQFIYGENGRGLQKWVNEKTILVFIMQKNVFS